MKNLPSPTSHLHGLLRLQLASLILAALCAFQPGYALAAVADISNDPLTTDLAAKAKPNIFFILDDSGSMGRDYAPDSVDGEQSLKCFKNHLYNGMYYNPAITYAAPVDYLGTSYPNSSFTAALNNGFDTAASPAKTNLSTSFKAHSSDTAQAAYYYELTGSGVAAGTCGTDAKYTLRTIGATEQTNFANWYSFYRTRLLAMKTSAGLSFRLIGDNYRVGYTTISDTGVTDGTNFLKINDFNTAQKQTFYTRLYVAAASSSTPLRGALSKAGRLYAGKLLTGTNDPVQYSCQQNFTILTTDGLWNTGDESSTYGPKQIDNITDVGNQDGSAPKPMWDGATTQYTTTITVSGGSSSPQTTVSSVKVNGVEILSGTTTASGTSTTIAQRIRDKINDCTNTITGNCGVAGYSATSSSGTVTLTAPAAAGAISYTPAITKSGGRNVTAAAFTATGTGGNSNSLADVAMYYYQTDLRTTGLANCTGAIAGGNVCNNDVKGTTSDPATYQHMTTFTVGLGVNGTLTYTTDYLTRDETPNTDYEKLKDPNDPLVWPDPIANSGNERIDDLWHAAVNGRGIYFSAKDPESLVNGLSSALNSIQAVEGAAAAAATSSLELVTGENFVFEALYRTVKWDGELLAFDIDENTGVVATTAKWKAQTLLDANVTPSTDSRTIHTFSGVGLTKLKSFVYADLSPTEKGYFDGLCTAPVKLTQCASLSVAEKDAAIGANLVNYLRGQTQHENQDGNTLRVFRDREHVLGDMINSTPVYVGKPLFKYNDSGYADFRDTTQKSRSPTVYVAANDGMLHAFNAETGQERWAYIPTIVMPNMHKLADFNYATNHRYFVDGSPNVGDACFSPPCAANQWKTILVGGLRAGGRGYYALDITDPGSPKGLWEFTHENLGLSFGNPIITKLANGKWVVIISSGYNNISTGDGVGRLYVLSAETGEILYDIQTSAGDTTTPSGLGKINAWVDFETNNTAQRIYGGDLLGNVWRFDLTKTVPDALLLAELKIGAIGQSVTTKPELAEVKQGTVPYVAVFVGTGRFLGESDRTDTTSQHSIYGLKDALTNIGLGDVRAVSSKLIKQTISEVTDANGKIRRKMTANKVDWATDNGWYFDFNPGDLSPGERLNVDMQLQLNQLVFATNVPNKESCTPGGNSYLYTVDYQTGGALNSDGYVGVRLDTALTAGLRLVRLANGKLVTIITDSTGKILPVENPGGGYGTAGGILRSSWRELID